MMIMNIPFLIRTLSFSTWRMGMNVIYSRSSFRIAAHAAYSKNIFIDPLIFFIETASNDSFVFSGNASDIASCPHNIFRAFAIFYHAFFKVCACNAPYIIFSVNFYNTVAIDDFSFIFSGNASDILSFRRSRILTHRVRKLPYHSKILNRPFIMGKQSHAVPDRAVRNTLIAAKARDRIFLSIKNS